jgi:flagellar biosynthetic protein FlhB
MAGQDKKQKTEKPTPKRKREARKEGQIARSPDLNAWTLVLIATYILPSAVGSGGAMSKEMFDGVQLIMQDPTNERMSEHLSRGFHAAFGMLTPLLIGVVLIALVMSFAQVGFVFTAKPMKPKFTRVNPMKGLKRIFSTRSLWQCLKGVLKMTVIIVVAYPNVRGISDHLNGATNAPLWTLVGFVGGKALAMVRTIAVVALILALIDYTYERRSMAKNMKMTKQEIKDEHRQQEGNPELKGKMKSRQLQMSRNRMLSMVRMADAVVVNPVHIAVALKYDPTAGAPKVLAKGDGWMAEKIKEEAERHQVAIVESIPLARALFAACQVDREIPVEMYEGVARLLAFVHHLGQRKRRFDGSFPLLPEATPALL